MIAMVYDDMVMAIVMTVIMAMVVVIDNSDNCNNVVLDCRRLNIHRGGTFLHMSQVHVHVFRRFVDSYARITLEISMHVYIYVIYIYEHFVFQTSTAMTRLLLGLGTHGIVRVSVDKDYTFVTAQGDVHLCAPTPNK